MTTILVLARTANALTHRHSRAVQRALAARAEAAARDNLGLRDGGALAMNRSHSRGLAAVALRPGAGVLGVDVEFADPSRPWSAILDRFMGRAPRGLPPSVGAAAWTFIEAWYKAFQDWPPGAHVETALNAAASGAGGPFMMGYGAAGGWWWMGLAADGFPVSVISGEPITLQRIDLAPVSFST